MLEDLTGLSARDVPLDSKEVMSLFAGTDALGIKPEDIEDVNLDVGILEFGRDFAMQMLIDERNIFGIGAYCRTFPWYICMAWHARRLIERGKGYHFHSHLYTR